MAEQEQDQGYRSFRERIRWLPIKNADYETMPPFGIAMLDYRESKSPFEVIDDQVVYRVRRCNAAAAAMQDPAMLVVNGPTPIRSEKIGKGHQDWPCQALHSGVDVTPIANANVTEGFPCGPVAGSWYVKRSEDGGFLHQSYDPTDESTEPRRIWISPGRRPVPRWCGTAGNIVPGGLPVPMAQEFGTALLEHSSTILVPSIEALWDISVSATLSSTEASQGAELRLTVNIDGQDSRLTGHRLQTIIKDRDFYRDLDENFYATPYDNPEPFYTAENVSFRGTLRLPKASQVSVVNRGPTLLIGDFIMQMTLLEVLRLRASNAGTDEVSLWEVAS